MKCAFGLFGKAIAKLEEARKACLVEISDAQHTIAVAQGVVDTRAAAVMKANIAIGNIKELIGEGK